MSHHSAFRLLTTTLVLSAVVATAQAHGVRHEVKSRVATVLTLVYHDGTPFAHERVEVRLRGADRAHVVGQTDARGRFAFVPDAGGVWECRAFSKDGHGGRFEFELTADPLPPDPAAPPARPQTDSATGGDAPESGAGQAGPGGEG